MIKRLQNNDIEISNKIRAVFQVSYKVEAKLLKATDFPPLKRPLEDYVISKNTFFGYLKDKELVGVINQWVSFRVCRMMAGPSTGGMRG